MVISFEIKIFFSNEFFSESFINKIKNKFLLNEIYLEKKIIITSMFYAHFLGKVFQN